MAVEGRPRKTEEEKEMILRKLAPHLRAGLSTRKSCRQAQVPESTLYDLLKNDPKFLEKFELERDYLAMVTSTIFAKLINDILMDIRQQEMEEERKASEDSNYMKRRIKLAKADIELLQWHASKSRVTKEEYGDRTEITGKDGEELIPRTVDISSEYNELLKRLKHETELEDKIDEQGDRYGVTPNT